MSDRILRMKDLTQKVGLSRSSINNLVKNSEFPKPVKLSARALGWKESEVDQYISELKTRGD